MIQAVSAPTKNLATYADLLALPEDVRAEIIAGEVVVQPSPLPLHQFAVGELYSELRDPFMRTRGGPGGWWFVLDVDVQFGEHDYCRPDIAGWRKENVAVFPILRQIRDRPDWICEALSPGTAVRDQGSKRHIYERAGVPWYWLLDPQNHTLTVLRLLDGAYVIDRVAGEQGEAALPPFEAVPLDLSVLFQPA